MDTKCMVSVNHTMDFTLFKLEKIGEQHYRSVEEKVVLPSWSSNGIAIAQAMTVAAFHKPQQMSISSSHIYFMKCGSSTSSLNFQVKILQENEDTCITEVDAIQGSDLTMKAQFCFYKESCEAIASQCHMPVTAAPQYCLSLSDALNNLMQEWEENTGSISEAMQSYTESIKGNPINRIFDIRVVDGESFTAAAMKGFFTKLWAKANVDDVKTVEKNTVFATHFVEATLVPSMLRYHMSRGFSPAQIIPVDFCCWFHNHDFTVNDWLLCENHFSIAKNGRAFIEHHLWTIKGDLVVTASSEAIVKGKFVIPKNARTEIHD
ncbi:unnamed protein product [Enterobius vermicularis]|uniref:Acyl-coenzyme A thioesterase 8 n=1 Tax=Enterobius vermicularis TaxID=51028 RepID=A0A158Q9S9_ENTVE|nr:unnamed protein product [Enterobius vermicularis]